MAVLEAIYFLFLLLYAISILLYVTGLFIKSEKRTNESYFVSVIIPAKNEKEHIESILHSVTHQTYNKERYEVIIVDDESTDITANVSQVYAENYRNIRVLSTKGLKSQLRYKKRPLDLGIQEANGEIILLTDADCHITSSWIETMVSYFTPEVGLVIGHSDLKPCTTSLEYIQSLDFNMLMGAARGSSQLRFPFACTGQNLAYRKTVFMETGGFSAIADFVGGDDTLFLQHVKKNSNWKIVFAVDPRTYVSALPISTLNQFLTQRRRWAADTLHIQRTDLLFFSVIVVAFAVNIIPLLLFFSLFITLSALPIFLKGLLIKFICEGILMVKSTGIFQRKELRSTFPLWFLFQIPYVSYMGILSFMGNRFPWGGRYQ